MNTKTRSTLHAVIVALACGAAGCANATRNPTEAEQAKASKTSKIGKEDVVVGDKCSTFVNGVMTKVPCPPLPKGRPIRNPESPEAIANAKAAVAGSKKQEKPAPSWSNGH